MRPSAQGRIGQARVEAVIGHDERDVEPAREVERAQAVGAEVRVNQRDRARPARALQPAEHIAGDAAQQRTPVVAVRRPDDDAAGG